MFEDSPVGGNWRAVKAFLYILPIDDFVLPSCNDNYAFRFPLSKNRGKIGLYRVSSKCRDLGLVTLFQFIVDNLSYRLNSCWLPLHTPILPQFRDFENRRRKHALALTTRNSVWSYRSYISQCGEQASSSSRKSSSKS